ncbi:site-specific integrase [Simiduia sp. 21SJ11W-1]|uniref:site-specific integrase n=1 Tax=Simiduia sp. 21SJ11W-1 TaxID=2909669 RepID=UPI0020A15FFE|nr:site-specific integrase [Simiduia sp. 21SJ11W-1]UTA47648.1 site-specific integrase [Simiduia sp. 21SJ11W-1]
MGSIFPAQSRRLYIQLVHFEVTMKATSKYLYLSKHGTYYLRLAIPRLIRPVIGRSELKFSLGTENLQKASLLGERERIYIECQFQIITKIMELHDFHPDRVHYPHEGQTIALNFAEACQKLQYLEFHTRAIRQSSKHVFSSASLQAKLEQLFPGANNITFDETMAARLAQSLANEKAALEGALQTGVKARHYFQQLQGHTQHLPSNQPIPEAPASTPNSDPRCMTLNELIRAYFDSQLAEKRWTERTYDQNSPKAAQLLEILGDVAIHSISRSQAREAREILSNLPSNLAKDTKLSKLPLREVAKRNHKKLRAVKTVNNQIDFFVAMFQWAINERHYNEQNPFHNLRLKTDESSDNSRKIFEPGDLSKLFSLPIFQAYGKNRHDCPSRYWGPIIAYLTGARIEEITSLAVKDIALDCTPPYIDINANGTINGKKKRLKNTQSARRVPIHPILFELGFDRYVARAAKHKSGLLFKEVDGDKRSTSDRLSAWFNTTAKQTAELDDPKGKVFHSFRHTFTTLLHRAGVDNLDIEHMTGHSTGRKTTGQKVYTHASVEHLHTKLVELDTAPIQLVKPHNW